MILWGQKLSPSSPEQDGNGPMYYLEMGVASDVSSVR